jgi:hypothetical protein
MSEPPEEEGEPPRIVLRANSGKWVLILLGSLAFVLLGGAMALGAATSGLAKAIGGVLVVLFGFCAVTALRQILVPAVLVIGPEAFELIGRGRHTTFPFDECGRFMTWRNPSNAQTLVVFDFAGDGDTELARQNRALTGGSRSLPANYGVTADELARLLNDLRGRR